MVNHPPGAKSLPHRHAGSAFIYENVSDAKPARLLAIFVVDESDKQLTIPDAH